MVCEVSLWSLSLCHWSLWCCGRVVVVVFDGDTEIERHTLDGDDPTVRIAVPVASGVFGIEIEDGGDGPYRDAVIVREAVVVRPGG